MENTHTKINNKTEESEEKVEQMAAGFVNKLSNLDETLMKSTKDIGDFLERVGEKIQIFGETIYKIGNTIEHMNDRMRSPRTKKATATPVVPVQAGASDPVGQEEDLQDLH